MIYFDKSSENENLENKFNLQLNGFEGPIDLLLDLARKQKIDLSEISIYDLAEQYINFIDKYIKLNLEIAADYLVMAAWLTYLKSKILLPKSEIEEEYSAEELEESLRYQLQRLKSIQDISKILYARPLIERDTFYVKSLDGIKVKYDISYTSNLYDLLKSYSYIVNKSEQISHLTINAYDLFTVDQAIKRLKDIFGSIGEWTNIMNLIPIFGKNKIINKSYISSNFVASLELTKNGIIEMKQNEVFGNIYVKSKD